MNHQPEVRKDLLKVFSLIALFVVALVALKMYDAKTNEVAKVGSKLLDSYVK